MSIDQLTEEAEADLANNNDPNNNSSNNDGDQQPDQQLQHDRNLQQQQQQQQQQQLQQQSEDGDTLLNKLYEASIGAEEDKVSEERIQSELDRDTNLILKLMPDKSYDEVRSMLEAHQDNPSRVQVCLFFYSRHFASRYDHDADSRHFVSYHISNVLLVMSHE